MNRNTPYATHADPVSCKETLYVRLEAVMLFAVACCDGVAITYFGRDRKRPYIPVDDAIEWLRKESVGARGEYGDKLQERLSAIVAAKEKYARGRVIEQ